MTFFLDSMDLHTLTSATAMTLTPTQSQHTQNQFAYEKKRTNNFFLKLQQNKLHSTFCMADKHWTILDEHVSTSDVDNQLKPSMDSI